MIECSRAVAARSGIGISSRYRRLLGLTAGLFSVFAAPRIVAAQQPYLYIIQPVEWRDNTRPTASPGSAFTVRGLAGHPSGVARVLVNGEEASLRPDADDPNLFTFEKAVAITVGMREITISVVPRSGAARTERFPIETPAQVQQPTDPGRVQPSPAGAGAVNPWGGFKKRGILYGAAAVGGAVLITMKSSETSKVCAQQSGGFDCFLRTEESPKYFPIGAGLVGGAVALTIIDAMLTSRKAKAAGPGDGSGAAPNASLNAPALGVWRDRVDLQLIRVRF